MSQTRETPLARRIARAGLPLVLVCAFTSALQAQVDDRGLTRPWKTDNFWAETYDKPLVTARGEIEGTDEKFQMVHWNSEGRIKFDDRTLDPPVWLTYKALTISIHSQREELDHGFGDVALGAALVLGEIGSRGRILAGAAIGTANDGRWDNVHALYPAATVEYAWKEDAATTWHFGLTLDGNRGLFQAVPLPMVLWQSRPEEGLDLLLGFPRTDIMFRSLKPMIFSVQWSFPSTASGRIEADLWDGFTLFADASRRIDGFRLRHQERTRIFYEMNTAELGFRWVTSWMDVSLSAGIAFGQRFFTGDDLRHRTSGGSVENLPFLALTLPSAFWSAPLSAGLSK